MQEQIKKYVGVAFVVLILALAGFAYYKFGSGITGSLTAEQASVNALAFINNTLLAGQTTAEMVGDVSEESGLYKMTVSVSGQETPVYVSKDGKLLIPESSAMKITTSTPAQEQSKTLGSFSISEDEVCLEDGKPVLYFFGSNGCSHCAWEHPIFKAVAEKFSGLAVIKDEMDNIISQEVLNKYNPQGSIPTIVLGCKYYRVGTVGEATENGNKTEADNLTALMCKLTNNQPAEVCAAVADLVSQIQ